MSDFDIASLGDLRLASFLCVKCAALLSETDVAKMQRGPTAACPVCRVVYDASDYEGNWGSVADFLRVSEHDVRVSDPIRQAARLGEVARALRLPSQPPPMMTFMRALDAASDFIHFATYGFHDQILGAMKLVCQRGVSIRGIVSGAEWLRPELREGAREAPYMEIRLTGDPEPGKNTARLHQKLLVVDGLLALKGSANWTKQGIRGVAQDREILDVESRVAEVREVNNRYFSKHWARLGPLADIGVIQMSDAAGQITRAVRDPWKDVFTPPTESGD